MALTPNPYDTPEFAMLDVADGTTGKNNVVEPPTADKNYGWHPFRRRPSRNYMNWLHRLTAQSINWMKDTFFVEVQNELNVNNILLSEGYPIIGLNPSIASSSVTGYPVLVNVSPGRCALSKIGTPGDKIISVIPNTLTCSVRTVWNASNNGLIAAIPLAPGSFTDLHLFIIDKDPTVTTSDPKLIFDTSPTGSNILGNAGIISEGYVYFRRRFSFRVEGDPLGSNLAVLPFAMIYKNKLTWTHNETADDMPSYADFGGGSGSWIYFTNTLGSYSIPGGVPLLLDAMFTTNPGFVSVKGRIRGSLNDGSWAITPTDTSDRDCNNILIDSDNFNYMQSDIKTVDAGTRLFGFKDNTAPYTGAAWVRVYIKGYEDLNEDFPI